MRLLNTTKRKLEEFASNKVPLYAILSHVWGKNEITFQDITGTDAEKKVGYEKLGKTCSIAADHGFDYVWMDTCCIDKTSSAELSEAINSMYRWYQESRMCYAYLADMPPGRTRALNSGFPKSRWFKRGWTLQELIAPPEVTFLDQEWQEIGTKSSLRRMVSETTGIPVNILLGGDLECASVAQRMSWASERETTRVEDLAYCLMGIFGINMPMLYGEGEKAFVRLQEEIMKVSDDHSLFVWKSLENHSGLLATSPAAFVDSHKIIPFNSSSNLSGAISVNNKGIHLKLHFRSTDSASFQDDVLAILPCTEEGKEVAIYMRAMSEMKEYFVRTESHRLELLNPKDSSQLEYCEKSICVRQERPTHKNHSPLLRAAEIGHEAVVKLLLEKGAQLESKSGNGQTPLSWAARSGHETVVELLLEKGAQLESRDKYGQTPLSWTAQNGHEVVVKLLLEKGAQLESKDNNGQTPLSWAAENGHEVVVKLLLEKSAELESKNKYVRTPLSYAAENGHEVVVKLLLEKGAQLESKSGNGQTPLSWAARSGREAVAKLLLEKGAQLESKSDNGQTLLSWAARGGHEAVMKLLLEKGAELESKNKHGRTPLSYAAENGHEVVVKLLLKKGAGLESKNKYVRTPLSYAAENGHEVVVKLLLEKGAQLESKSGNGQTPLSWAAENGREAVLKLLLEKGAQLESKDEYGWTPLSYAAENGHEVVVKLLLRKGAQLESKGEYGWTPLSYAAENGHEAVVKLLLGKGAQLGKGAHLESKDGNGRTPPRWLGRALWR